MPVLEQSKTKQATEQRPDCHLLTELTKVKPMSHPKPFGSGLLSLMLGATAIAGALSLDKKTTSDEPEEDDLEPWEWGTGDPLLEREPTLDEWNEDTIFVSDTSSFSLGEVVINQINGYKMTISELGEPGLYLCTYFPPNSSDLISCWYTGNQLNKYEEPELEPIKHVQIKEWIDYQYEAHYKNALIPVFDDSNNKITWIPASTDRTVDPYTVWENTWFKLTGIRFDGKKAACYENYLEIKQALDKRQSELGLERPAALLIQTLSTACKERALLKYHFGVKERSTGHTLEENNAYREAVANLWIKLSEPERKLFENWGRSHRPVPKWAKLLADMEAARIKDDALLLKNPWPVTEKVVISRGFSETKDTVSEHIEYKNEKDQTVTDSIESPNQPVNNRKIGTLSPMGGFRWDGKKWEALKTIGEMKSIVIREPPTLSIQRDKLPIYEIPSSGTSKFKIESGEGIQFSQGFEEYKPATLQDNNAHVVPPATAYSHNILAHNQIEIVAGLINNVPEYKLPNPDNRWVFKEYSLLHGNPLGITYIG